MRSRSSISLHTILFYETYPHLLLPRLTQNCSSSTLLYLATSNTNCKFHSNTETTTTLIMRFTELTLEMGSDGNFAGAGVANAGPNSYSSLSRIRAQLPMGWACELIRVTSSRETRIGYFMCSCPSFPVSIHQVMSSLSVT